MTPVRDLLERACGLMRLDRAGAEVVHLGENALFRLSGGVVAARREVAVAWVDGAVRYSGGSGRWGRGTAGRR